MPNPNESSGRRTNNNNVRAAVACRLAKALSAVPILRDADIDLAFGRKAQNSSKAGPDTRAVVAKRCARMLLSLNSGIAASTLSTCSMVVECLQFGAALLAEGSQRIRCVAVHQLVKF